MKKIFIFSFVVILSFLLVVSVFAVASAQESFQENEKIFSSDIGEEALDYVTSFAEKRGVNVNDITNVSKVDFNDLPKEVNIENVNDANLAIYQVNYNENTEDKKVFVVTYSLEKLKAQGDLIVAQDKREFLNFGFEGTMVNDGFLKTATGVESSLEKGYVMARKGSITTISTNLEITKSDDSGKVEIIIYKNGEMILFGNTLDANGQGIKKDYDVQSKDTVTFEPGDVISVYAKSDGNVKWKDVITLVEITTN